MLESVGQQIEEHPYITAFFAAPVAFFLTVFVAHNPIATMCLAMPFIAFCFIYTMVFEANND
jgi:hypothetical protein